MLQRTTAWTPNRIYALVLGIVFTILGIIGFTLTTSTKLGEIFSIFDVDLVHNLLYLITGLLGLAAAFTAWSRSYNQGFGVFYIIVSLLALIPALYLVGTYGQDNGLFLGLTHMNAADLILQFIAALIALALGYFAERMTTRRTVV